MAGLPCPVRRRHRRPPRCPLHRSRSKKFQSFSVSLGRKRLCHFFDFFPLAGLPCPVPGRHRRPPRCRLHRSRSKKFQSFSVSLGMKRLSRFYDFRPMAEPAASYEEQNSDVKIYRADITSRPTRGSEISGDRRFGFPGLEAPLALFPLHVLIGSALSTIKGYTHVRAEIRVFPMAGLPCPDRGRHRRAPRCPHSTAVASAVLSR